MAERAAATVWGWPRTPGEIAECVDRWVRRGLYKRPPDDLMPVVEDLIRRREQVITLDELAAHDTGRHPRRAATALLQRGWLRSLPVRGAWGVEISLPPPHTGGFEVLRARLRVKPDTPACVGGKSVAQIRCWLFRPTSPIMGWAGDGRPPETLRREYGVARWRPQIPLDEIGGLPVWKPETLLCYMAGRPGRYSWEDIHEYLWAICENINLELVCAEMQGRKTPVWARAAYLLERGERPDLGDSLINRAPPFASGPYYFGRPMPWWDDHKPWIPVWSAKHQVIDYQMERHWSYYDHPSHDKAAATLSRFKM